MEVSHVDGSTRSREKERKKRKREEPSELSKGARKRIPTFLVFPIHGKSDERERTFSKAVQRLKEWEGRRRREKSESG
jgi:hypothetical protein